ncbi:EMC3/TMCO1 family protein [Candidatus Korarchaeum cryptofilum]|jgi:uncharacterized membrane protein (DUF106 family)|uniref:Membrane protein-like protein n=1 Tax=Korarchaeum cryptofilum (strain OPF8) TaxID=374847 RepID=B1L790_KORCO|nr:EMC3/TMCO1 family protein [Candidatus Korarchaeum cryptofilum]ACB08319.1 membrane protein-like protein [Candidatus Korarchaeum cryptofilum OPF8]
MDLSSILFPPGSIIFLTFLALAISLGVNLINKRTINYERMRELQKIVKEYTDLQRELIKNPDDKRLKKKLDKMKPQFDAARAEMSRMNMRPLLYTTIPIIVIFWLLGNFYADIPVINLPFPLPWILDYFHNNAGLSNQTLGYVGYYVMASFLFSAIFQRLFGTTPSE